MELDWQYRKLCRQVGSHKTTHVIIKEVPLHGSKLPMPSSLSLQAPCQWMALPTPLHYFSAQVILCKDSIDLPGGPSVPRVKAQTSLPRRYTVSCHGRLPPYWDSPMLPQKYVGSAHIAEHCVRGPGRCLLSRRTISWAKGRDGSSQVHARVLSWRPSRGKPEVESPAAWPVAMTMPFARCVTVPPPVGLVALLLIIHAIVVAVVVIHEANKTF